MIPAKQYQLEPRERRFEVNSNEPQLDEKASKRGSYWLFVDTHLPFNFSS